MRAWLLLAFVPAILVACASANDSASDADAAAGDDGGLADDARTHGDASSLLDADVRADADAVDAGPCPLESAYVVFDGGRVCVDLYEGAIVHVAPNGAESAWPGNQPVDALDAGELRAVVAHGRKPQGYISSGQAEAACKSSKKRLCTMQEWTAACRGRPEHDYVYPYGDTYEPGACNEGKPSPIVELFGPNPTYSSSELNDPRNDTLEGGLASGGDYAKCVSTYGAFDMHGNIHEWVVDDTNPTHGSFMGGFFVDAKLNGAGCTYRTTAHERAYHDYSTGFRCCADPR